MRVVIQRVRKSKIVINQSIERNISIGMLILLGIEDEDKDEDVDWLCAKIPKLRIFPDQNGVMNLPITDINGEIMIVSQFTLHAKTKKGNRPSYIKAANPDIAIPLYESFIQKLKIESQCKIETGEFGADMQIELVNDGPVTLIIDTKNKE